jgi:hypothetical protein
MLLITFRVRFIAMLCFPIHVLQMCLSSAAQCHVSIFPPTNFPINSFDHAQVTCVRNALAMSPRAARDDLFHKIRYLVIMAFPIGLTVLAKN